VYLKNEKYWLCLPLLLISWPGYADLDFLKIQLLESDDEVVIAAEYSYFDISLDFLDFAEKVNSASTPERSTSSQLSVLYPITERLKLGYEYKDASAMVSRTVEPFELETRGDEHKLHASYKLGAFRDYPVYVNFMGSTVKQDTLEIDCYSHNGLVLGGTCEGADIRLLDGAAYINKGEENYYPALTADASANVYKIGLELRGILFDVLPFYQKIDFQQSKPDVRYNSKLLEIEDSFLLNVSYKGVVLGDAINNLSATLPQKTPWTENAVILEFGSKLQLVRSISASMALKHYRIQRADYEYGDNEKDYDNNTVLNLALWYEPTDKFKAYLRGEVSHHNLLGMDPLAYNRKTSKFFAQPQGTVSLGLMVQF
tara:strand:- start:523 stop:1635 length:1113 start_codon:yes stop_codon:yes gene_type:complete